MFEGFEALVDEVLSIIDIKVSIIFPQINPNLLSEGRPFSRIRELFASDFPSKIAVAENGETLNVRLSMLLPSPCF